jgi:hypothetical protein
MSVTQSSIGDCGDLGNNSVNPKDLMRKKPAGQVQTIAKYIAPIGEELVDPADTARTFETFPLVPFLDGSDITIQFLADMKTLSPTHGACIEAKKTMGLGKGYTIEKKKQSRRFILPTELEEEEKVITREEFFAYFNWLIEYIPEEDLDNILEAMWENYETFGNVFVELILGQTAGKKWGKVKVHDFQFVRYWITPLGKPRIVGISPQWDYDYLTRNGPDFVKVFPHWTGNQLRRRTIFHIRNKVSGRVWYGLPKAFSALFPSFNEVQMVEYNVNEAGNKFTGEVMFQTFIDPEDENGDLSNEPESFLQAAKRVYSSAGRGEKIMHQNSPPGADETKVHQFSSNLQHDYYQTMFSVDEGLIIRANNWDRRLLGEQTAGSLGGTKEIEELRKATYRDVIQPVNSRFFSVLNRATQLIAEHVGNPDMAEYSIKVVPTVDMDDPKKKSSTDEETFDENGNPIDDNRSSAERSSGSDSGSGSDMQVSTDEGGKGLS